MNQSTMNLTACWDCVDDCYFGRMPKYWKKCSPHYPPNVSVTHQFVCIYCTILSASRWLYVSRIVCDCDAILNLPAQQCWRFASRAQTIVRNCVLVTAYKTYNFNGWKCGVKWVAPKCHPSTSCGGNMLCDYFVYMLFNSNWTLFKWKETLPII